MKRKRELPELVTKLCNGYFSYKNIELQFFWCLSPICFSLMTPENKHAFHYKKDVFFFISR